MRQAATQAGAASGVTGLRAEPPARNGKMEIAGNIRRHTLALLTLLWTARVGVGLFTLRPGRLMNALVTG